MLLRRGATVDVLNEDGQTPLELTLALCVKKNAGILLDAGAKLANLKQDRPRPNWFVVMLNRRTHCRQSCLVFYGVLRKRWRLSDGQRMPRDMNTMLTRMVWPSWRDARWHWEEGGGAVQEMLSDEEPWMLEALSIARAIDAAYQPN